MKKSVQNLFITIHINIVFILVLSSQMLSAQVQQDSLPVTTYEKDTIIIPYKEIELDCLCIRKNKYIVIRSYEEMIALFKHANSSDCRKFSPTKFDFEKEIIIGFNGLFGMTGIEIPRLEIVIEKITHQKKIRCAVNIIEYPFGKLLYPINKTLIFPIESNDWSIEVDIIDTENRFTQTNRSCYDY